MFKNVETFDIRRTITENINAHLLDENTCRRKIFSVFCILQVHNYKGYIIIIVKI